MCYSFDYVKSDHVLKLLTGVTRIRTMLRMRPEKHSRRLHRRVQKVAAILKKLGKGAQ